MDCWARLGIAETADKREIKRAYAKLVKQHGPEDDAAAFQSIREAYDLALLIAEHLQAESAQNVQPGGELPASTTPALSDRPPPPQPPLELLEKERVRDAQAEKIEQALTRLVDLLKQGEAAAIEFCRSTLKDEFFQALDVRYEFEGRLLLALIAADVYSTAFHDYLAEEFAWDIDIYRRDRMVINPFDGDMRFSGAFFAVVQPYLRDLIRRSLAKKLRSSHPRARAEDLAQVDRLLFGASEETALATYCKRRRNRALIKSAYDFLTTHKFVTPQYSFVAPQTLQWMVDHRIVRAPAESATEAPQPLQRRRLGLPWWAIGIVVVAFSRVASLIGTHSDSYVPPLPANVPSYASALDRLNTLRASADNNDAEAQFQLGLKYLRGDSPLARDPNKGLEWIKRAAEQKHAPAQELLGIVYYTGSEGPPDPVAAVGLLAQAAESGRADATYWLAAAFAQGRGVERDDAEARRLLDRSVELGSTEGLRAKGLELMYATGKDQDVAKGAEYLKTSAGRGNPGATYQLAREYLSGQHLEIDYEQARQGLESLSARAIPMAQFWLSQLYEKGLGVPADSARARQLAAGAKQYASPEMVNQFAWELATIPNAALRNGDLAVALMEELLAEPKNKDEQRLDTLAAAYAEAGDFDRAIATEREALNRLPVDGSAQMRGQVASRLKLYEAGKSLSTAR